jgi:hypothetical protein
MQVKGKKQEYTLNGGNFLTPLLHPKTYFLISVIKREKHSLNMAVQES